MPNKRTSYTIAATVLLAAQDMARDSSMAMPVVVGSLFRGYVSGDIEVEPLAFEPGQTRSPLTVVIDGDLDAQAAGKAKRSGTARSKSHLLEALLAAYVRGDVTVETVARGRAGTDPGAHRATEA